LGILGGTFNPIHYGHLVAANDVWDAFALDLVVFVPAAVPPHKLRAEIVAPHHRLTMAIMATLSNPHLSVSAIEIERSGASYTVDTISQLKQHYTEPLNLYFIVGVDAFLDIASWRQPDVLLKSCHTVVTSRPGYDLHNCVPYTLQQLSKSYAGLSFEPLALDGMHREARYSVQGTSHQIFLRNIPGVDISSTTIRDRVKAGRPLRYLLPDSVDAYIRKYHLYR
jgi:nicotinate-nucleotide adenylyltransferase